MKIGLVGAPGSGKTEVARALQIPLGAQVVDGYVEEIEIETNMAFGAFGSYIGNLHIALGRYARERKAAVIATGPVITCGTMIETAIYTALHFASLEAVTAEADHSHLNLRVDATLRILTCFYLDIFRYDHLFYLPAREPREAIDVGFIDQQIQAATQGFKICPITPLINPETRVEEALKALEVQPA